MKTAITIVAMLVMTAMCGCQSSNPQDGGMTKGAGSTTAVDAGSKIAVPTSSTEVKKGEIQPVMSAVPTTEACSCNRPAR